MPKLTLSFVSAFNERVQPLMDGAIQPEGLEIIPTYSPPSETFWRQLKFQEFDISEMSLSSYLIARCRGVDMIALPVFPSRRLFHAEVSVHADSGVSLYDEASAHAAQISQQDAAPTTVGSPPPCSPATRVAVSSDPSPARPLPSPSGGRAPPVD